MSNTPEADKDLAVAGLAVAAAHDEVKRAYAKLDKVLETYGVAYVSRYGRTSTPTPQRPNPHN